MELKGISLLGLTMLQTTVTLSPYSQWSTSNTDLALRASEHYNSVPGRYAGRIGNAQYTMDGVTYNTENNEGKNTLHSGSNGWGYRTFDVVALSEDSITFYIHDPSNSSMGMPGGVDGYITYQLSQKTWNVKMTVTAPEHKTRTLTDFFSTAGY